MTPHLPCITAVGLALAASAVLGCEGREVIAEITEEKTTPSDEDPRYLSTDEGALDSDADSDVYGQEVDCGNVVAIGRETFFVDGPVSLGQLEDVTHVRGSLYVGEFDAQRYDVSSLRHIRCVDGDLVLYNIDNLFDLNVFSELRFVKYDLVVSFNSELEDLSGLRGLEKLGGNELYIHDNPSLPNCRATRIYDGLIDLGWEGMTCIRGNEEDDCDIITNGCGSENFGNR